MSFPAFTPPTPTINQTSTFTHNPLLLSPTTPTPHPIPSTPPLKMTSQNPYRRTSAYNLRLLAAQLARDRPHPLHLSSPDETSFRGPALDPSYLTSFTKGLPHHPESGLLLDPRHFRLFVKSIQSGSEDDFRQVPLGPHPPAPFQSGIASPGMLGAATLRAWESAGAGLTFDLQGPDSQAVTMPSAPRFESDELAAEVAELYWMALLRDVPFSQFSYSTLVPDAVVDLNGMPWLQGDVGRVTDAEQGRLRGPFTIGNVFRGVTRGDHVGPYLSQFLLAGTGGLQDAGMEPKNGVIAFGASRIDQRVRVAEKEKDYMTTFLAWLDVQNGANVANRETYSNDPSYRFMTTPRDLATYVHVDRLYQAYFNACLILLDLRAPFDEGIPFQDEDRLDKQQGFAVFGGPQLLALVTEVSSRALKAVRYQKFNVHRRGRPELMGGLLDRFVARPGEAALQPVGTLYGKLSESLLVRVETENRRQNVKFSDNGNPRSGDLYSPYDKSLLLPMAFPEGSPMHPSYGAGHGAVAGACVTVLKAFFDGSFELPYAFEPNEHGTELVDADLGGKKLTVEGELNKLCSNISIGRNWAGVHYFSDYIESIRLGEEVALGILEEQKLTYGENFSITVPLFDGSVRRI